MNPRISTLLIIVFAFGACKKELYDIDDMINFKYDCKDVVDRYTPSGKLDYKTNYYYLRGTYVGYDTPEGCYRILLDDQNRKIKAKSHNQETHYEYNSDGKLIRERTGYKEAIHEYDGDVLMESRYYISGDLFYAEVYNSDTPQLDIIYDVYYNRDTISARYSCYDPSIEINAGNIESYSIDYYNTENLIDSSLIFETDFWVMNPNHYEPDTVQYLKEKQFFQYNEAGKETEIDVRYYSSDGKEISRRLSKKTYFNSTKLLNITNEEWNLPFDHSTDTYGSEYEYKALGSSEYIYDHNGICIRKNHYYGSGELRWYSTEEWLKNGNKKYSRFYGNGELEWYFIGTNNCE